jgi:hypothetical protein
MGFGDDDGIGEGPGAQGGGWHCGGKELQVMGDEMWAQSAGNKTVAAGIFGLKAGMALGHVVVWMAAGGPAAGGDVGEGVGRYITDTTDDRPGAENWGTFTAYHLVGNLDIAAGILVDPPRRDFAVLGYATRPHLAPAFEVPAEARAIAQIWDELRELGHLWIEAHEKEMGALQAGDADAAAWHAATVADCRERQRRLHRLLPAPTVSSWEDCLCQVEGWGQQLLAHAEASPSFAAGLNRALPLPGAAVGPKLAYYQVQLQAILQYLAQSGVPLPLLLSEFQSR